LGGASLSFSDTRILGNLKYTTPSNALIPGDDSLSMDGLRVGGSVTLAVANGDNSFVGANTLSEVGGSFTYTGGTGIDNVDFSAGAIVGTSATIGLGESTNRFRVITNNGLFVGTKLTVTGGAGNDTVEFDSTTPSRISGAGSFNLGNGINSFRTTALSVGTLGLIAGSGNDTGTFDNLNVVGAATLNFGSGTNTFNLASAPASVGPSRIGGALTVTTGTGADTIQLGVDEVVRVGGAAKFTLGTNVLGNGIDTVQISNAQFASTLGIVTGAGADGVSIGTLFSVGIAGKLSVNLNAGDDQLTLGKVATFCDPAKIVRLLVAPTLSGGTGTGDIIRIFTEGFVEGPPSVVVHPTGPSLTAAGWETVL
jgi:hypothetical protein